MIPPMRSLQEIQAVLEARVDLLTPGALRRKPRLNQRVQEDLVNV